MWGSWMNNLTTPDFDHDVIIVGSGPAGVSTWLHLHKFDPVLAVRTLVVEKAQHPRHKLCGGGVMRAADVVLSRLGIKVDVPSVPIHNVEFRYRSKRFYWRQKDFFRVVRRHEFDAALVKVARQRGMTLHELEAFQDFTRVDGGIEVETSRGSYRVRALVGADGAQSLVRTKMSIEERPRVSRLIEILTPANGQTAPEFTHNTAVLDFSGLDRGLQGYVWDFPCWEGGATIMNRGIYDGRVYPNRPRADLKSLFRGALQARDALDPNQRWEAHPERWFHPKATYAQSNVLLVGDAAGVEPFAGEGISFALQYGEVAAAELVAAFRQNDYSFAGYRDHIIVRELGKSLVLRRRLARLTYPGWPPILFNVFFQVMSRIWP
jgi:flavin-dependent dehydrogenase